MFIQKVFKIQGRVPWALRGGDQEQWIFPQVVLSEEEKRYILAAVVL